MATLMDLGVILVMLMILMNFVTLTVTVASPTDSHLLHLRVL